MPIDRLARGGHGGHDGRICDSVISHRVNSEASNKHTLENGFDVANHLVLFCGEEEALVMLPLGVVGRRREGIAGGGRSHFEKSTTAMMSRREQWLGWSRR